MITEFIKEWQKHFNERLNNPVLGPFTALWLAWNWRLIGILIFSSEPIEKRIDYIDKTYINFWDLLIIPFIGATLFAVISPWLNLLIQKFQNYPNICREKSRLVNDTEILQASVEKAEAQANLNRILAQDEITRRQQEELASLKDELTKQKEIAESRIETAKTELEQKRKEYEERKNKENAEAHADSKKLKQLEKWIQEEQERTKIELDRMKDELYKKQMDLDSKLQSTLPPSIDITDAELKHILTKNPWKLFHNPNVGPERSKIITFEKTGEIKNGNNNNESKWRIQNGILELIQTDGEVHSRFRFLPENKIFIHSGDPDIKSARGQFIIPEPMINNPYRKH